MTVKFQDYYSTLGVARAANQEDIQRAYRRLARLYHPDVNRTREAETRFKSINEAHHVLSDPDRRRRYDELGPEWESGEDFEAAPRNPASRNGNGHHARARSRQGMGAGFSDFFDAIFGEFGRGSAFGGWENTFNRENRPKPIRGENREAELEITVEEAHHGARKRIEVETTVPDARGRLKTHLRHYHVAIPAGVTDGSRVRLSGEGGAGENGGAPGDLILRVRLQPHHRLHADGYDLRTVVSLAPWEAALGAAVQVHGLDGRLTLTVPPGTQGGQTLRLRGRGLNRRNGARGDLLVVVRIAIPLELSRAEKNLFRKLARESRFKPRG